MLIYKVDQCTKLQQVLGDPTQHDFKEMMNEIEDIFGKMSIQEKQEKIPHFRELFQQVFLNFLTF